jgi:hypothetical protein
MSSENGRNQRTTVHPHAGEPRRSQHTGRDEWHGRAKVANQAEHSYRLEGNTNRLRRIVGHRVRVNGKLEDRGDVTRKETTANDNANGKHSSEREIEIKPSDLPKVEVVAVANVADTCGARKPHRQRNGSGRNAL